MTEKTKPKKENPPNLYRRGPCWILDFYFKGRRYTESLASVSRSRAKEIRDKRKGEAAAGELVINGHRWINKKWIKETQAVAVEDPKFENAVLRYLNWYQGQSRPSSYERQKICAIPLNAAFGAQHLSEITVFSIEKYRLDRKTACSCAGRSKREKDSDRCPECKRLIRAMAPATINREVTMLKHLFNKALKWKLADSNPMLDVKLYKENNARIRHLNDEEAACLLAACSADFRIVVLIALLTGFRRSELRSLRWLNIDFVNGSITVESGYTKNGETGTIPLHPDLAKALRELYDDRKPAPEDPVLVNRYNKPWRDWRTAFSNACKRAGISDFHFHDLRHTYGSWLAKNGTDIKARMELMRHKTPAMTMRYSHLSVEYKRAAVANLPSFSNIEKKSQQISQQPEEKKVVAFTK